MCKVNINIARNYYFVPLSIVSTLLCNGSGCVMGIIFAQIIDTFSLTRLVAQKSLSRRYRRLRSRSNGLPPDHMIFGYVRNSRRWRVKRGQGRARQRADCRCRCSPSCTKTRRNAAEFTSASASAYLPSQTRHGRVVAKFAHSSRAVVCGCAAGRRRRRSTR